MDALPEAGEVVLPQAELHHARRVLRLGDGAEVRVFDATGREGVGELVGDVARLTGVEVRPLPPALTIAAATPKGERADWMVEKLAELGVTTWVPLLAEHAVVRPKATKLAKLQRRAIEAAKQADTPGVLRVAQPAAPEDVAAEGAWLLTLGDDANAPPELATGAELTCLVGPEGGWSDDEERALRSSGCVPVTLAGSVLRIETAALAVAAVVVAGRWRTSLGLR